MGTLIALLVLFLGAAEAPAPASQPDVGAADAALRAEPAPVRRVARTLQRVLEAPWIKRSESCLLLDETGEPRAVVWTRSLVGPLRQVHERDMLFATGGFRVHHTEEVTPRGRRVVWRELRPTGARSWTVRVDASGANVTGYGWQRPIHETLAGWDGSDLIGPLELSFALRTGMDVSAPDARYRVIDPSAGRATDVRLVRAGDELRAQRIDGTDLFVLGPGTVRFQGDPTSVRAIAREEAERLRRRWAFRSRPAHEVVLATIRGAR